MAKIHTQKCNRHNLPIILVNMDSIKLQGRDSLEIAITNSIPDKNNFDSDFLVVDVNKRQEHVFFAKLYIRLLVTFLSSYTVNRGLTSPI